MRIVVKVGTSTLAYPTGRLNIQRMERLCKTLSDLKNAGHEIILVSSGAIAMGFGKLNLSERPKDMPGKQASAAVGQCELMYVYDKLFTEYNHIVGQLLITAPDIADGGSRKANFHNTMDRLLELGALPVINENDTVSTEEIAVGDNDTLSAIVAATVSGGPARAALGHRRPLRRRPAQEPGREAYPRPCETDRRAHHRPRRRQRLEPRHRRHGDQALGGADRCRRRAAKWSSPTAKSRSFCMISSRASPSAPAFWSRGEEYDNAGASFRRPSAAMGSIAAAGRGEKERAAPCHGGQPGGALRGDPRRERGGHGRRARPHLRRHARPARSSTRTASPAWRTASATPSGLPDHTGRDSQRRSCAPTACVIDKVQVPLGLVAIIYESRPNVTSDAAALAVKSGNVCMLRSGKEAYPHAPAPSSRRCKAGVAAGGRRPRHREHRGGYQPRQRARS